MLIFQWWLYPAPMHECHVYLQGTKIYYLLITFYKNKTIILSTISFSCKTWYATWVKNNNYKRLKEVLKKILKTKRWNQWEILDYISKCTTLNKSMGHILLAYDFDHKYMWPVNFFLSKQIFVLYEKMSETEKICKRFLYMYDLFFQNGSSERIWIATVRF
jgi:hypothetical protein